MRLLYIAHEFPVPANHGGKVDIWQRIKAFKKLGVEIFLITWYGVEPGEIPTAEDIEVLKEYINEYQIYEIGHDINAILNRLKLIFTYPSSASARYLKRSELDVLFKKVADFQPEGIFLDGIYGGQLAFETKKIFNIPVFTRLHNIENLYLKKQAQNAVFSKRKIALYAATIGLERYENYVISNSEVFFDISTNDLNYWINKGFTHGKWLPPVLINENLSINLNVAYEYEVGFLGNLYNSNNVDGVKWFINSILPVINAKLNREIKVLIMGSNPSEEIFELVGKNPNITLLPNVKNPSIILEKAKVLINPIRFGSGVTIKTIDMLFLNHPVVTCSQGVKGLPLDFEEVFSVSDSVEGFAEAVVANLNKFSNLPNDKRIKLRDLFGLSSIAKCLETIKETIKNKP